MCWERQQKPEPGCEVVVAPAGTGGEREGVSVWSLGGPEARTGSGEHACISARASGSTRCWAFWGHR